MDRYASEAAARADELLDLMTEEQRDLLAAWLAQNLDDDLIDFICDPADRVLRRVAQTPSKDADWVRGTPWPRFVREWLAVRHWAIASARALQIAAVLENAPRPYRKAVLHTARLAVPLLSPPSPDDWLSLRMAD